MTDRDELIEERLHQTHWADWARHSLANDASARTYERLLSPQGNESVILMNAPPQTCGSMARFVTISDLLRQHGLCAPQIHQFWESDGLMVLEDLGTTLLADTFIEGDPRPAYHCAIEALVQVQNAPVPADFPRQTEESTIDFAALAWDWYAPNRDLLPAFRDQCHKILSPIMQTDPVIALVDYHAENIVWRADRSGLARVGLLDFQDAVAHHPAFDLVLLLRDARRDIPVALRETMLDTYIQLSGRSETQFRQAFASFAAIRNIRLLGIFARLAQRDGKPGYLKFMPRVWQHLTESLADPVLSETLGPVVLSALPPPTEDVLQRFGHDR